MSTTKCEEGVHNMRCIILAKAGSKGVVGKNL
jgi:hypothetical protein